MLRRKMTIPRPNSAGRFTPEALFRPRSVVVFGAATEAGAQLLANLAMGGFKGEVCAAAAPADIDPGTQLSVLAVAPNDWCR